VAARGRRRARGVPHPVSAALDEVADTVTEGSPEVYAEIQRAFDGADDVAAAAREIADSDSGGVAALYERPAATARDGSDTSDATATDDATTATDDDTTATDDAATETRTNMIDREAVRNNANYLRNVRPIDPEEIAEYIEGSPHPAVVRETLREEAFDLLRLREREDGAFEPVSEEPVPAPGWAPTALPENYSFALEDLLVREFGANWHREESGDKLREAVRRLKDDYLYGNDVAYDRVAALARLRSTTCPPTTRRSATSSTTSPRTGCSTGPSASSTWVRVSAVPRSDSTTTSPMTPSSTTTPSSRAQPPTCSTGCSTRRGGTSGRRSTRRRRRSPSLGSTAGQKR